MLKIAVQRERSWRVGSVRTRVVRDGRVTQLSHRASDWNRDGERISDSSIPAPVNAARKPAQPPDDLRWADGTLATLEAADRSVCGSPRPYSSGERKRTVCPSL